MSFVGIDLGTTNCAIAECDAGSVPTLLPNRQLVAAQDIASLDTLPSFVLLANDDNPDPAMTLPWQKNNNYAVGEWAKSRGQEVPTQLVSSAKSWLVANVDEDAPLLPVEGERKISPVDALAKLLQHMVADQRDAGNTDFEHAIIAHPASFDPRARASVMKAAVQAGLGHALLIEEPLAAFYAWLASQGKGQPVTALQAVNVAGLGRPLGAGDVILVVDIGGGTTDFSLIETVDNDGQLGLERVAVGDHILLGGDNMDALLAHLVNQEWKAQGKTLDAAQQRALLFSVRTAKEQILGDEKIKTAPVTVLGRGSKLFGNTLRAELTREMVTQHIVEGFFPMCSLQDAPQRRTSSLRTQGLPYASDPAVTKHLAEFLRRAGRVPTAVLWNGGVLGSPAIAARISQVLGSWFQKPVAVLEHAGLHTAVALGAAYYAMIRESGGLRVRSGLSKSYYIGIESSMPAIPGFAPPMTAVCVAPKGTEEGSPEQFLDNDFYLGIGERAEFRFFSSSFEDEFGRAREIDEDGVTELAPVSQNIQTTKRRGQNDVLVQIASSVSDVGELVLACRDTELNEKWQLSYGLRDAEKA